MGLQQRLSIFLALSLTVVVVPAGTGQDPVTSETEICKDHDPHPPIRITGELGPQGFVLGYNSRSGEPIYRPGSGVVDGDGSPEDPYVIEGWCIRAPAVVPQSPPRAAITILNTDAHVTIQDNVIDGLEASGEGYRINLLDGVLVDQDAPVTITGNEIRHQATAVRIESPSGNLITRNGIHNTTRGILLNSANNTIRANQVLDISRGAAGISAWGPSNQTILNNEIRGGDWGVLLRENTNNTVSRNSIQDSQSYAIVLQRADESLVSNNTLEKASTGILAGGDQNRIENNTVGGTAVGIRLTGSHGNYVLYNDIESTCWWCVSIEVDRGQRTQIHHNNLEDPVGLRVDFSSDVDARRNWWDDETGPKEGVEDACSGASSSGPGAEIEIYDDESKVCFEPWLEAPVASAGVD